MAENKDKTNIDSALDAETMNLNDNCGRDMRIVTDGQKLEDGIVELTDKKEYIDEP